MGCYCNLIFVLKNFINVLWYNFFNFNLIFCFLQAEDVQFLKNISYLKQVLCIFMSIFLRCSIIYLNLLSQFVKYL